MEDRGRRDREKEKERSGREIMGRGKKINRRRQ